MNSVNPPSYIEATSEQQPGGSRQPVRQQQPAQPTPRPQPSTSQPRSPPKDFICKLCYVGIGKMQERSKDDKDFHERLIRVMCHSSVYSDYSLLMYIYIFKSRQIL